MIIIIIIIIISLSFLLLLLLLVLFLLLVQAAMSDQPKLAEVNTFLAEPVEEAHGPTPAGPLRPTANLPIKIIPTKIRRLKTSGKFPVDMRIPPLNIRILLESNPLKYRILRRSAVPHLGVQWVLR